MVRRFTIIVLALAVEIYPSDVPMTRPEECLGVTDGIGAKASFVEVGDGRILMAANKKFYTSSDGGLRWSAPFEPRDVTGATIARGGANLVRLSGNAIGFSSRGGGTPDDPQYLLFWRSEDGGRTWQKPVRISPPTHLIVEALNDTIIRTASGRLILPVYDSTGVSGYDTGPLMVGALRGNQFISTGAHHLDPTFTYCYVYYSDDDGRTWHASRTRELYIWDRDAMTWRIVNEPTVVEVEPGKLLMYMRADSGGRLYKSWSFDNGMTWSAPAPTPLASSGSPAQLRKIPQTGDLLVVWSQAGEDEIRRGLIRARLSSAVSRTNGAIWEFFQNVESVLEGSRVEPGPIRFTRPEGLVVGPLDPAPERNPRFVLDLPPGYCRCSYPAVFFHKDRLIVAHSNAHLDADGRYVQAGRVKVLPVSWLYGGAQNMKPSPDLKKRFALPNPAGRPQP